MFSTGTRYLLAVTAADINTGTTSTTMQMMRALIAHFLKRAYYVHAHFSRRRNLSVLAMDNPLFVPSTRVTMQAFRVPVFCILVVYDNHHQLLITV